MFILAQSVLVQEYALKQAQKQLADAKAELEQLRQQAAQPKRSTSFLGSLLGRSDESERPASPPPPPPPSSYSGGYNQNQVPYTPVPNTPPPPAYPSNPPSYGAPSYAAPAYAAPAPSATGGFLRGAAQTAAGVAAGALAFEGIESLMHGFGHSAGYGSDFGGFGGGGRPEEVVNNYYVEDSGRGDDRIDNASYNDGDDRDVEVADSSDYDTSSDDYGSDSDDFNA
jgi:hypothetical protein